MHIVDNFAEKTTFFGGGDGKQDAATCLKKHRIPAFRSP